MKSIKSAHTLIFLVLTFIISWIFMFGIILFELGNGSILHIPFIALCVLGPGIAAMIVSLKKMSFKEFLKRNFTFEQRFSYYAIFLIWAVWRYFLCMVVGDRVEGSSLTLPLLLIPVCIFTGGNEEFGWRFLQRQLEKKMHSVPAVLIITVICTLWHLPWWLDPWDWRNSAFDLFIQFGFILTNSFSLAVILKLTNSVLLCVLVHTWGNAITMTFLPSGDLKTIIGFAFEGIIGMIILILHEKRNIKQTEVRV